MGDTAQLATLHPNARRYSEPEIEAAYFLWRTAAGRSCREVARRLDASERTVQGWSRDRGWTERANQEDHEDIASIRHAVGAIVTYELVPSIETAKAIRDNPELDPRVRLDAAKWLAGLGGVSPVSKIETAITHAPPKQVIDAAVLSDGEIEARESLVGVGRHSRT